MLLPGPCGGESVLDRAFRLPAELFVGEGGVCPDRNDVARAARRELIVQLQAVDLLEGCHQLLYRNRTSRTDIEDLITLLHLSVDHPRHCCHMGLGEVHDVDVVAEACAVFGRVVVAEDAQALALADRGLGDERNEVVRHTARKFADECRRMGSDRIEVAEGDTLDRTAAVSAVITCGRKHDVAEDVLAHLLGVSIRGSRREARSLLCHRKFLGLAVNCRRRREQDVASAVGLGSFEYVEERDKVVAVVHDRLCNRFSHSLEGGEMNHSVDLLLVKKPVD